MDNEIRRQLLSAVNYPASLNQPQAVTLLATAILDLDRALTETQPSSPATTPTADTQSGESISWDRWHLVREDQLGMPGITVTVTYHAFSSHEIRGLVLQPLLDAGWTLRILMTSESPSPSGPTSLTPPAPEAGPSAGEAAAGESALLKGLYAVRDRLTESIGILEELT